METTNFIGSKISLVSKSEIRYEGVLYALDLQEATISLAKVKSFGTEERPTPRPVAPKDEIYEFIIFRGSDIKGIDVIEAPVKEVEEEFEDPAILEVKQQQPIVGVVEQREPPRQQHHHQQQHQVQQQQPHPLMQREIRGNYSPRGRGNHQQQQQQRGGHQNYQRRPQQQQQNNQNPRQKLAFEAEFDFEKANEELQVQLAKIKIVDDEKKKEEEDEEEVYYQKDNFFDNISCEATERQKGKPPRSDWRAERKLNAETFGLPPRGSYNYNYRGYRGNYRGRYNNRGPGRGYAPRGFRRGYYRGGGNNLESNA